MGTYVNPGNDGFREIVAQRYIDKTGLISLFDATLETTSKLVMVSRPRRFGKSFAAKSLVAFYSCGCESRALFEGLDVARREGWDAHLNALNVAFLEMTGVIKAAGSADVVPVVEDMLLGELREIVPGAGARSAGRGDELMSAMIDVVRETGRRFVFVIDEWDAPYRLAAGDKTAQDAYAEWLRGMFKNSNFTPEAVAGAYLTGILPIRKYAHQSAVSDFSEYTMLDPAKYAPYVGFTGEEVEALCDEYAMDLADVQRWYDGYRLEYSEDLGPDARPRFRNREIDAYAPYSLMRACERRKTGSYWPSTESIESLLAYVDMDFDGLQRDLARAVGGEALPVDVAGFRNDLSAVASRDDVLTLLAHLGYLVYDAGPRTVRVPNEEVRLELARAVSHGRHPKLVALAARSARLLGDIQGMRADAVAEGLGRFHDEWASPLFYSNEQALRSVVKIALMAVVDEYARIEELPGGKGYADVAYVPAPGTLRPALLVELKWDKPADAAIAQIRERGYPEALRGLDVPVLLVGVTYDSKTKEHSCRIEELETNSPQK